MKRAWVREKIGRWLGLLRPLWRAQILSCRCLSISRHVVVAQKDAFLNGAEAIRLELLIRWPVLIPKERRVLAIRLSPDSMSGEDCGHIESDVRVERVGEGNYTKVRITPARAHWQNRDWLHVDVLVGPSVRLLAKLSLRILATAAVQQQVIEKLKPTGLRLWVRNRAGFRIAEAVTGTSGYIVPEFIIPAIDFSAFTAPFRVVQIFELITPTGRLELS